MTMVLRSYETQSTEGEKRIVLCTADDLREPEMMHGSGRSMPGSTHLSSDQATIRITIVVDVNDEEARRLREFLQKLMQR